MKVIHCQRALLSILLLPLFVQAQVPPLSQTQTPTSSNDVRTSFDRAAAKHKEELRSLWRMRSAPDVYLPDVSSKSLAALLAMKPDASGVGYSARTAILFYSYDQGALTIWVVNKSGISAYNRRLLSQEQISTVISNMRESLGIDSLQMARTPHQRGLRLVPESDNAKLPVNQAVSAATQILLPDSIAGALHDVDHLIVVPILGIGTVPFAVLQPFGRDSFLIDEMSISVAPSLFDLGQPIDDWDPEFSSPLIVGNPFVPPSDDWTIPALPGAEIEAKAVARALKAEPLLGRDATKESVSRRLSESDFLYFATHGVASVDDPLSGGFLLLSAKSVEQGELTAREVQDTVLPDAKIVVLSGCQTGLGRAHDAGVIGLARAFQIAGVARVIMSLWSVNDQATSELMQAFVKNMRSDIPAEALRKAMIEIRKKRPKPSEWASFVLFGTPR